MAGRYKISKELEDLINDLADFKSATEDDLLWSASSWS